MAFPPAGSAAVVGSGGGGVPATRTFRKWATRVGGEAVGNHGVRRTVIGRTTPTDGSAAAKYSGLRSGGVVAGMSQAGARSESPSTTPARTSSSFLSGRYTDPGPLAVQEWTKSRRRSSSSMLVDSEATDEAVTVTLR